MKSDILELNYSDKYFCNIISLQIMQKPHQCFLTKLRHFLNRCSTFLTTVNADDEKEWFSFFWKSETLVLTVGNMRL